MGTRLLLAIPVLLALAIASISPSKPAAATRPTAAATAAARRPAPLPPAPTVPAPTAPAPAPPAPQSDDTCTCPQQLVWEECEPQWHQQDSFPDDGGPTRPRKHPAPGSQDGPI